MKLYLVRHGQAVSEEVNPLRPLSHQGLREVKIITKFLRKNNAKISLFYHSGKIRSQQTAELIQHTINRGGRILKKDSLGPEDPIEPLVVTLKSADDDLLIAGHLPYLSYLVARLLTGDPQRGAVTFSTGALAILEKDKNQRWSLSTLVSPDQLA
jgi:phosphohistidine phosphatase